MSRGRTKVALVVKDRYVKLHDWQVHHSNVVKSVTKFKKKLGEIWE